MVAPASPLLPEPERAASFQPAADALYSSPSTSLSRLLVRLLSRATAASRAESTASHRLSTPTLRDQPTIGHPDAIPRPVQTQLLGPTAIAPQRPPASLLLPTSSLRPAFLRLNEPRCPSHVEAAAAYHKPSRESKRAIASAHRHLPLQTRASRAPTPSFAPGIAGVAPPSPRLASPSAPHPDCVALLPHCGYGVGWTASGLRYSLSLSSVASHDEAIQPESGKSPIP